MKNKISELRKQIGLTQEELANDVDVTRQTIISLEQGKYNPSLGLANKIKKSLKQKHLEDIFTLD
jgi:putative transcriptional regulator